MRQSTQLACVEESIIVVFKLQLSSFYWWHILHLLWYGLLRHWLRKLSRLLHILWKQFSLFLFSSARVAKEKVKVFEREMDLRGFWLDRPMPSWLRAGPKGRVSGGGTERAGQWSGNPQTFPQVFFIWKHPLKVDFLTLRHFPGFAFSRSSGWEWNFLEF